MGISIASFVLFSFFFLFVYTLPLLSASYSCNFFLSPSSLYFFYNTPLFVSFTFSYWFSICFLSWLGITSAWEHGRESKALAFIGTQRMAILTLLFYFIIICISTSSRSRSNFVGRLHMLFHLLGRALEYATAPRRTGPANHPGGHDKGEQPLCSTPPSPCFTLLPFCARSEHVIFKTQRTHMNERSHG